MNRKKLTIRATAYLAIVLTIFFIIYRSGIDVSDLSPDMITHLAHNNILIVFAIMLVIMILQNLFTFIPLVLVITINISLFGFWPGYFLSALCSVIGSTLIFLSIRYIFPNAFAKTKLHKYEEKIKKNGFMFVFLGRILPFMPTNLINIVSGLSSIKLSHFVVATTCGNLIYGLVLSSASFSIIALFIHNPLIVAILAITLIAIYFMVKKRKKSLKSI
ncbi:TVP38/TMEM64 family protein [Kurthia sibirica]|uniref:TVP38/TMEM64 family membrane protein n=1 Tax=Kurthia sibirica TaxID=202750 RepID=A0A2U3APZ1_9BACL|nr:VTT domain-containing protein [Kurthia sibirica]PWI26525.1 TVP38/TMEM64 family protein [Kurthia sibirica]GEK32769.1 hypothetical protein KSI01_03020 [Kurthia sibirica]